MCIYQSVYCLSTSTLKLSLKSFFIIKAIICYHNTAFIEIFLHYQGHHILSQLYIFMLQWYSFEGFDLPACGLA